MEQHLFDLSQSVPHADAFVSEQTAGPATHGQIQNRRNEIRSRLERNPELDCKLKQAWWRIAYDFLGFLGENEVLAWGAA